MLGRSERLELGDSTKGAGLRRLWVREAGEESLNMSNERTRECDCLVPSALGSPSKGCESREVVITGACEMVDARGLVFHDGHLPLKSFTPFTIRNLSPRLAIPISLRAS
jgi:hypothetical protein